MKGLFTEYDNTRTLDYPKIWSQALLVFDTNVLLGLYRLRAEARDELLAVIDKVSDRIWLPHQVALEFQKNRLTVIAKQNKLFNDVEAIPRLVTKTLYDAVEKLELKKRNSPIDVHQYVAGHELLSKEFLERLTKLREKQQQVSASDPLKEKLEALFGSRVGTPYDQQEIDKLYLQAEVRFKHFIPPGYVDAEKGKAKPSEGEKEISDAFSHKGVTYKRRYGDFIVWQQLITYAKSANFSSVIFITDDQKEDWWWKVAGDTLGPRPELVDEALRIGGVQSFLMYNSENFLKYARDHLQAQVSDATLTEVRDLSMEGNLIAANELKPHDVENAVQNWLVDGFEPKYDSGNWSFDPHSVTFPDGMTVGLEIKIADSQRGALSAARELVRKGQVLEQLGELFIGVLITDNAGLLVKRMRHAFHTIPQGMELIIGSIVSTSSGGIEFIPYEVFTPQDIKDSVV